MKLIGETPNNSYYLKQKLVSQAKRLLEVQKNFDLIFLNKREKERTLPMFSNSIRLELRCHT